MATRAVDYNALAQQAGAVNSAPPPQANQPAPTAATDYDTLAAKFGAVDQPTASDQSGQIQNDVGNTVIVPKNAGTSAEESFSDTLARGVALGKQRKAAGTQQSAIDAEMATVPKKTAQTLGAAAAVGVAGPAALAGAGEATAAGLAKILPHTIEGIKAIGQWADAHPAQAVMLLWLLKEKLPGMKQALGFIKAAPIPE
jgi:hypothetical protein